jgi:threonine synthase
VGFAALSKHLEEHSGSSGYFLETAHPAKFSEVVGKLTGVKMASPIMPQPGVLRTAISMVPDTARLREFLLDTSR